jgi:hypothetical protein
VYIKGNTRSRNLFLGGRVMKKMLLILVIGVASLSFANSLDDAAVALYKGEVSETTLKNTFSKVDFELILEKYKSMKLEKAKREAEKEKANYLLKKRNEELEEEIKKIKEKNSLKKLKTRKISLEEAIRNTYQGVYGDNPERVKRLKELGFSSQEIKRIQDGVNKLVGQEQDKAK